MHFSLTFYEKFQRIINLKCYIQSENCPYKIWRCLCKDSVKKICFCFFYKCQYFVWYFWSYSYCSQQIIKNYEFMNFSFFHQTIALQKLWKMFFISSKTPFVLQIFKLFVIFSLPFHTFQIQNDKWKWNNLWCHELACINLQV